MFCTLELGPVSGPLGSIISLDSMMSFGPIPLEWSIVFSNHTEGSASFVGTSVEIDECCQETVSNINADPDQVINLTDVTLMTNDLFRTFEPFPCPKSANVNVDPGGLINLTDLTLLINHLFNTFEPLPACP